MRSETRPTDCSTDPCTRPTGNASRRCLHQQTGRIVKLATVAGLAVLISGSIGCKAMPLKMPAIPKPDFAKMAFWKKDKMGFASKESIPKPPARSFSPSSSSQTALASNRAGSASSSSTDSPYSRSDSGNSPIRRPYSADFKSKLSELAKLGDKNAEKSTSPRTEYSAEIPQASSPNFDTDLAKIRKAQADFNAALASSKQAAGSTFESATKTTEAWKNDFDPSNDFKRAKTATVNSLAQINKNLYDRAGNLASSTKKDVDDSFAAVQDTANKKLSLFEARLKAAAAGASESVAKSTQAVADKAVAKTNSVMSETLKNTQSEVESLKTQLAELKAQQAEFLKQQVAAAEKQAAAMAAATAAAADPTGNQFAASPMAPAAVAPAARSSQSAFAPNATTAPAAYPSTTAPVYPSSAPVRTASSSNHFMGSAPPNVNPPNVLRGNFSPVQSSGYETHSQQSQEYPATPHGSYAPRSSSAHIAGPAADTQASFTNRHDADGNLVITASTGSDEPVIVSSIPDAILRGESSYAPGSVQPLRR